LSARPTVLIWKCRWRGYLPAGNVFRERGTARGSPEADPGLPCSALDSSARLAAARQPLPGSEPDASPVPATPVKVATVPQNSGSNLRGSRCRSTYPCGCR
jgi:hypothetical protein